MEPLLRRAPGGQLLSMRRHGSWDAIKELIEVGDDRVVVCATLHAEGRGSEIKLEGDIYHCIWLRPGRFFRQEDHLTVRGALHALGLDGGTLEAAGLRAA